MKNVSSAILRSEIFFLRENNDSEHDIFAFSAKKGGLLMFVKWPLIGRVCLPEKPL